MLRTHEPFCLCLTQVETDKATVDFTVQDEGYLAKILVDEGTPDVPLGQVVAITVEEEDDVKAFANVSAKDFQEEGEEPAPEPKKEKPEAKKDEEPEAKEPKEPSREQEKTASSSPQASARQEQRRGEEGDRIFASPLARKIMRDHDINPQQLKGKGSGPNGRILRPDVEDFLASSAAERPTETEERPAATTPPTPRAAEGRGYVDVELTDEEQQLGQRLTASKQQVPHYYLTAEITLDKVLALRDRLGAVADGISLNDFFVRAAALAMRNIPEVNASWLDDGYVRYYEYVDINVSMASEDGTLAPVVRDVHALGLAGISETMSDLSTRIASKELNADDLQVRLI